MDLIEYINGVEMGQGSVSVMTSRENSWHLHSMAGSCRHLHDGEGSGTRWQTGMLVRTAVSGHSTETLSNYPAPLSLTNPYAACIKGSTAQGLGMPGGPGLETGGREGRLGKQSQLWGLTAS